MYDRTQYILSELPNKSDLLKLFSQKQELTIFDIGGCEGEDSIRYSRLFPNAAVFVFEPLPKNQQRILETIKNYNAEKVTLLPIALSDNKGVSQFYVSSGHPEEIKENLDWDFGNKSSSLLPPDKHLETTPWVKFDDVIDVQTNTLSDFLVDNDVDEIDFVHMDVQGAELKVLNGAGKHIKKIKAIWLEVADITLYKNQPTKTDIEIFMTNNGFHLAKSRLEGKVGDQLYLNESYFDKKLINAFINNNKVFFFFRNFFGGSN
jgi:FkbM family methyltransferase